MDYKDLDNGISSDYWYFKGKSDIIKRMIAKILKGSDNQILNIGCGTGDDIPLLREFGNIFAAEYSLDSITHLKKADAKVTITRTDAHKLNYRDESFDCIIMLDVLEHLEDDRTAMTELTRVLKKGGTAIITVPAHKFMWSTHDEALGHKRRYTRKELKTLIEKSNLSITRLTFWNSFIFPFVAAYRIMKKGNDKESPKPDVRPIPRLANSALEKMLKTENILLEKIDSPCGISLLVVAKKE